MDHAQERRTLILDRLSALPSILESVIERASPQQMTQRAADGTFALVEHACHLADLEEEGFAVRLQRLLSEEAPFLPDFQGEEIARNRKYLEQHAGEAASRFKITRIQNLKRLGTLDEVSWALSGTQENVGPVTIGGVLESMLVHDVAHASQLVVLLGQLDAPIPADLEKLARDAS